MARISTISDAVHAPFGRHFLQTQTKTIAFLSLFFFDAHTQTYARTHTHTYTKHTPNTPLALMFILLASLNSAWRGIRTAVAAHVCALACRVEVDFEPSCGEMRKKTIETGVIWQKYDR
jgi:hypothetical protein